MKVVHLRFEELEKVHEKANQWDGIEEP